VSRAGVRWTCEGSFSEEVGMSNRVVHFEIPYDDRDRARGFYSEAFGWELMPMDEMSYTMVMTGPSDDSGPKESGFINGGMMERSGDFTSPNLVIDVENIDKTLEIVGRNGGSTVMERRPVGDMGFVAYFKDTEGNLVGLWETSTGS
jgi:predicted enzyme related to lactoylglutathione lyase